MAKKENPFWRGVGTVLGAAPAVAAGMVAGAHAAATGKSKFSEAYEDVGSKWLEGAEEFAEQHGTDVAQVVGTIAAAAVVGDHVKGGGAQPKR